MLFHTQPSRHHQTFLKKGREVIWGNEKGGEKGKKFGGTGGKDRLQIADIKLKTSRLKT